MVPLPVVHGSVCDEVASGEWCGPDVSGTCCPAIALHHCRQVAALPEDRASMMHPKYGQLQSFRLPLICTTCVQSHLLVCWHTAAQSPTADFFMF